MPSAAIVSQLPLDVVGGGERFTLQTHRSAVACGEDVDLWCAAGGHPPLEPQARRMEHAYHRVSHAGGRPSPVETVPLRELLRRQAAYDTLVIHQHLVNASSLDFLSASPPTQRVILTSLGAEPIGALFAKAYEPHSGLEIVEISRYAAARSSARGMQARGLSAGVWRAGIVPPAPRAAAQPLRAVAVGRLLPHKAFEVAIDAVACLGPAATLTIIGPSSGDASYERHLSRCARRAGNCRIAGCLDDVRRERLLAQADILLANSAHVTCTGKRLDQPELLGLVILEAVAGGTLPIASDIPSFREICLELGLGEWLYPERDAEALRGRMLAARALAPEDRCRILREASARLESCYLWDDYWLRLTRAGCADAVRRSRAA